MNRAVLILRPEPGAGETAERARRLGLETVTAPLFTVRPLAWEPPDPAAIDAVLLTSANAARHSDAGILLGLPCYAVGEATAAAASSAGFGRILVGGADGAAAVEAMARDGVRHALHLCGRDHVPLQHPAVRLVRRIVYAADAANDLPRPARDALARGALALIHSPRAASVFAGLVDRAGVRRAEVDAAAISHSAAAALGPGWRSVASAGRPRDEALLELVAQLCQIKREASDDDEH